MHNLNVCNHTLASPTPIPLEPLAPHTVISAIACSLVNMAEASENLRRSSLCQGSEVNSEDVERKMNSFPSFVKK